MWLMQDGAPAHFSRIVREFLNNNYTNRWIGRRGPIAWPARGPCKMELQHMSAALLESFSIIFTPIDGLVEEDPSLFPI